MKKYIVGCSGFSYWNWKGSFYPEELPQSKWFAFYCEHFGSLELNSTFYHFPRIKTLEGWYNKSPQYFIFSVKAPRGITHFRKLKEADELIKNFYHNCKEGLKEKLGPLLFQFPPSFIFTEENLSLILNSLDADFMNVVEFRHKSWWDDLVYKELAKKKITFCGISHPTLPDDVIINTNKIYFRFHGVPKLFYSGYDNPTIKNIADKIIKNKKTRQAFFYFNNTASIESIDNAQWLQQYVDKQ